MNRPLKYKSSVELIFAFILAFTLINIFFHDTTDFENMALGVYTKPYFGKINNFRIQTLGLRNKDEIVRGSKTRKAQNKVLILGNSQTHSINQYKIGNVTFPELLADSLNPKSIDVIASSVPNATMEDFYLLYKSWNQFLKIKMLVMPIFLDDTREEGIQSAFYNEIKSFRITDTNVLALKINMSLKKIETSIPSKKAVTQESFQEKVENKLDVVLDSVFDPWYYRPNIRGEIFSDIYKLRNTVVGINAKTKRRIIKDIYNQNIQALSYILDDCRKNNIKVLVYIPPIRFDYEIPYYRDQYIMFKRQIESLSKKYEANFINLEKCVPDKYWGFKGTRTFNGVLDIDFMHFQYPGHILMADTLKSVIEEMIN